MTTIKYSDLTQSPVTFHEADHSYILGEGQELTGITSVLKAVIYRDKYAGIPEEVLRRASQRGSAIHAECEREDILPSKTPESYAFDETRAYIKLKADEQINIIANEYLVSDSLHFATMIDCVDDRGNLYDIKTTSELDTEYISWQLSLCAYLYEMQNSEKGLTAGRLFGIHLRGEKAELVEVARKSREEVEGLLKAYHLGEYWGLPELSEETATTLKVFNLEREIVALEELTAKLKEARQTYFDELEREMEQANIKKYQTANLTITRVAPSKGSTFDSKAFKNDYPELAEQYQKESIRKGYIKVTLAKR